MLTGEEFGRLFETFGTSAFRLETLAAYDVEAERKEFEGFLRGEPIPRDWAEDNPWVRSMTRQGKSVARVHVVRSPLSAYLRFEFAAYPGNIAAGESIGIIDLARGEVPGLPDHDFWLFDDARVLRMHYTDSGAFLGAEPLPDNRLAEYRRYRDIALAHAVSFAEYQHD
ncbi:hypothetical protein RM780_08190 [Streptomyces sp. DSM 44917]|uniref:DUF6879 domain-containing protein n=1 Tax=Streptomyces boetiae TaxID=3075541 RepID=A0ABU2L615_9ACTN|nr:DUF6879 family protein [Streptomyces sp. DSM 44917]MDT0306942.1 hypothetical protein [Streptomyces sp. DSM 44917]